MPPDVVGIVKSLESLERNELAMLLSRWDADVSDEVGRGVACEA